MEGYTGLGNLENTSQKQPHLQKYILKESKSSNNLIVYTSTSSSTCNTNTIKYRYSRYPTPKIERLCSISGHVEHVEGESSQECSTSPKVECGRSISGLVEGGGSQGGRQAPKSSVMAQILGLLREVVAREIDKP